MTINRRQLEILWLRAQEGDCWAQEQFQSFGLLIGIPFISIPKYMTVGEMPCHLPLNFLIDESHYPLPFSSLNETYSFSKEIRSRSINPAKTIDSPIVLSDLNTILAFGVYAIWRRNE